MEKNPFEPSIPPSAQEPLTLNVQRERLFAQDPRLLEAANRLSAVVRSTPRDPKYPDIEPCALVVGGFVRDAMLERHPKDIDLEIYGVSPERLEELLNQIFPGLVNTVGKSFGILKIRLDDEIEFDVSIPRRESKTGSGHRGFTVASDPGMSVEDAARRRDFTMNAVAADLLTGTVIDPFGGLHDIQHSVLRVTDPERFQDDPLRVYRAVQFAARMELTADAESIQLMREMVTRGDLAELAPERVTEELKKLFLKAEKPSIGLELMRTLGITEKYFPELQALIGTEQEAEWHPEGDVWIHTLMVTDEAAKLIRQSERALTETEKFQIMFGALCHDLGKPATTQQLDGRLRSRGHEEAGEAPTKQLCKRLALPNEVVLGAVAIAKDHLKPGTLYREFEKGALDETRYANAARKLIKRLQPVSWRVLLAASEADSRGRSVPGAQTNPYLPNEFFRRIVASHELDAVGSQPLLLGRDLAELGVKPGIGMGNILREIEQLRDEGKIKTKAEAIEEVRRIIKLP